MKKNKKLSNLPGPGSYNLNIGVIYAKQPGIKIGKEKRQKLGLKDIIPGPDSYLPNLELTKRNVKKWSIKGSFNEGKDYETRNKELVPGPGKYNISDESSS
jgi:hypothetical protein